MAKEPFLLERSLTKLTYEVCLVSLGVPGYNYIDVKLSYFLTDNSYSSPCRD